MPESGEELRIQRTMDVAPDSTVSSMLNYLKEQEFDPAKVRYESPLNKRPTYEDLLAMRDLKDFEVLVVGIKEESPKMRVFTGKTLSVSAHSIGPSMDTIFAQTKTTVSPEDWRSFFEAGLANGLRASVFYPIVEDDGVLPDRKWGFMIHNHPKGGGTPSTSDLINSVGSEQNLIVSKEGVTVLHSTNKPSNEFLGQLPPKDRKLSVDEMMFNVQIRELWEGYAQLSTLQKYKDDIWADVYTESNKKAAELMGISFRVLKWDEDKQQIEDILKNLL